MINSRKYMMGTKLLQTKGTWYWDGPTCMSALIVICKREYIGKGQTILPGNGPSTTFCLAMGFQQNIACQRAFSKTLHATGLQQNFDWQWAFNKILPGNGPSTKF